MVLNRFASISEENFTRGAEFIPERWETKSAGCREKHMNSTGCITSKHYIWVMNNVASPRTLAPQFYNNIDNHFKHTFLGKPVRILRILDAIRQAYYSG